MISCSVATGLSDEFDQVDLMTYPNPAHNKTTVRFECKSEWVKITVVDMFGNTLQTVVDRNFKKGHHDIGFNISELDSGNYLVSIQKGSGVLTTKLQKY